MLTLLFALSLSADLSTANIASYTADSKYTYSGRTMTISWCYSNPTVTYDLEVVNLIGEYREVSEIGLTGMSYDWVVPRTGSYMIRIRARGADNTLGPWNESVTNGEQQTSGCEAQRSFLINAITAPPTSGGFEP
jgi:hypothetical protein